MSGSRWARGNDTTHILDRSSVHTDAHRLSDIVPIYFGTLTVSVVISIAILPFQRTNHHTIPFSLKLSDHVRPYHVAKYVEPYAVPLWITNGCFSDSISLIIAQFISNHCIADVCTVHRSDSARVRGWKSHLRQNRIRPLLQSTVEFI